MKQEWLFTTKGVELVRSSWDAGSDALPSAWQSLDRPRICFPESLLIFGSQEKPEVIVPGGSVVLDADREHSVKRVDDRAGQSVWIGIDPEVFDECSTPELREQMRGANSNTGMAAINPDPRSVVVLRHLVGRAGEGEIDQVEAESLLYSVIERMCRLAGESKPRGRKNAPSRGGGVYKDAVAHAASLLSVNNGMTLEEIGDAVNLSPHHFCRVFKRYTGMTIHGYRQHIRLTRAVQDVLDTDRPLAKIASDHGFSDQSHMTRCFSRAFGVPPALLASKPGGILHLRTMIQDSRRPL